MLDMSIAREVGILGKEEPFCFGWTGGLYRYEQNAETANIQISGNSQTHNLQNVRLVKDLDLPTQQINYQEIQEQYPYTKMANLHKLDNPKPMLLIGQQHGKLITSQSVINTEANIPIMSKTKLGWVMHGPVKSKTAGLNFACCHITDDQFSLEGFGVCTTKVDKTKSADEQMAINKIASSIIKVDDHYQTNLPWKDDHIQMPNSRPMAEQRLKCLERKLLRNRDMANAYQKEINKLLTSGYAKILRDEKIFKSPKLWFLPHFAVINPKKPGKVRLVFDAAAEYVLQSNPKELHGPVTNIQLNNKPDISQKVLGIIWNARQDVLTFSTSTMHSISDNLLSGQTLPTKRKVLAAVNSVYDPLGLVTPTTIKGRILMRDIWESGIGWDDVIKGDPVLKWHEWITELKLLTEVCIPRCYSLNYSAANKTELHVFCDASSKAYAAAAYMRVCYAKTDNAQLYDVALIASRARVSPLKHVTIPKLEKRTWRATRVLIECFWKRFLKEYLPTLVNRPKWTKDCQNLREIVVIRSPMPRGDWPLGIVLKTFPGEDNVVRVAEVKTANNVFRRPVSSLCRLQIISDRHYRVETETQH
ncbi:hypothetical protein ACLKA6_000853 [Drosophila palustris]